MTNRMALRRGFTLMELIVAMLITGVALSVAAAALMATIGRSEFIESLSRSRTRTANAEHLLREMFRNLNISDERVALRGKPTSVRIESNCITPHGWFEPCSIAIALDSSAAELTFRATIVTSTTEHELRLPAGNRTASIVYLEHARNGGAWRAEWSVRTPPLATGIVIDGDTLIIPVGRGR